MAYTLPRAGLSTGVLVLHSASRTSYMGAFGELFPQEPEAIHLHCQMQF